jgi:hypothetical protein
MGPPEVLGDPTDPKWLGRGIVSSPRSGYSLCRPGEPGKPSARHPSRERAIWTGVAGCTERPAFQFAGGGDRRRDGPSRPPIPRAANSLPPEAEAFVLVPPPERD